MRISLRVFATTLVLAGTIAACSDKSTTEPQQNSPLAGLSVASSNDTVTTPQPTPTGSGYFRGTVMGPSVTGPGTDTLKTSPRIADVVVTIYQKTGQLPNGEVTMGPAMGSTTTNAQGLFTLPTLPAGEYVVTFVPPAASIYHGVYAFGPLRSNSSSFPWWVVLPKK